MNKKRWKITRRNPNILLPPVKRLKEPQRHTSGDITGKTKIGKKLWIRKRNGKSDKKAKIIATIVYCAVENTCSKPKSLTNNLNKKHKKERTQEENEEAVT